MAARLNGLWSGVFCVAALVVSAQSSFTRKLLVELNPGAPPAPPPEGDLLHVRAIGVNDTLHYLFSSQGAPALLLVHTDSASSAVQVNWPQFLARNTSGGLRVEPESSVVFTSALVFSRLLEYNDVNDTAEPTSGFFPPYDLQNFTWSHLNLSGPPPTARLCGAAGGGSLCLQLDVFGSEGRGQSWPRLLHSANSSQLKVWFVDITPRSPQSRFLLELQAVGGAYPLSQVGVRQSIDDEFTPSIFKVSQWVSSGNGSSDVLGFVQWKPVAYRRSSPVLEDATPCRHLDPRPQSGEAVASSSALIRAFFSTPESVGLNVSFGLAGEPFYNSTRFLSWTLLMGVGSPPVDSFSPLVIGIMAVGLGTPLVLLLLGGVYVCLRKRGGTSSIMAAYEPIN